MWDMKVIRFIRRQNRLLIQKYSSRFTFIIVCSIVFFIFRISIFKKDGYELTVEKMGIYVLDTELERPLFRIDLLPWKVENTIRSNTPCKVNHDIRWGMVFVVKSALDNFDRRNAIRETWGNVKVYDGIMFEMVFVLGDATDSKKMAKIAQENNKHGDILQYGFKDTPQHVPEKVLAGMQWASQLPSAWLYTSIDDDISVDFAKLGKYFNKQIIDKYSFSNGTLNFLSIPMVCVYSYQDRDPPNREPDSKWYMPEKDFPGEVWPVYCRGGAYTTTSYMVKKLFQVSRRTVRLYLDDVWVTGFMRLKVKNTNYNIVAAPGSRLNEAQLHKSEWPRDSIVKHAWGNIAEKKVNVPYLLIESWMPLYNLIKDKVTCFGHFKND